MIHSFHFKKIKYSIIRLVFFVSLFFLGLSSRPVYAQADFINRFRVSLGFTTDLVWPFDIDGLDSKNPATIITYLISFLEIIIFVLGAVGILIGFRIIFLQYLSGIDKYDEESMKRSKKRLGYLAMGWIVLIFGLIFVKALQKFLNLNNGGLL